MRFAVDGWRRVARNAGAGVGLFLSASYATAATGAPAGKVLADFGGSIGMFPRSGLTKASDHNFYGTASEGGLGELLGTVFKVDSLGNVSVLHSFTGAEGSNPAGGVVQGDDGNLYGTTNVGGDNNCGTIFRLSLAGSLTVLHSFNYSVDGCNPVATLAKGSDGALYGTTNSGGQSGVGTIFSITESGQFTSLHSFTGWAGGEYPTQPLVQGQDGNWYGVAGAGQAYSFGNGMIFRLSQDGTFTNLHAFNATDGIYPSGALIQTADGSFYGVAQTGGTMGLGTVYKLAADGSFSTIHTFSGVADGADPVGALAPGAGGNLYGVTQSGGAKSFGSVFQLAPDGTLTTLYSFTDGRDGASPAAGLVRDGASRYLGVTMSGAMGYGTVFVLQTK